MRWLSSTCNHCQNKYRIDLLLCPPRTRYAVLGNAGTLISFRLGGNDAPFIARELLPTFDTEDLVNLPNYHIYLKLMIDGAPSKAFSAETLTPDDLAGFA